MSVRRLLFASLLALGLAALACAGCSDDAPAYLHVTPERLDFGRLLHGGRKTLDLTLTNGSDRSVFVTAAKANCTCFEIHPFRRTLDPGESRVVRVTFHSALVPVGRMRGKELEVFSNDKVGSRIVVKLDGSSITSRTIEPAAIELKDLQAAPGDEVARIRARPGAGLSVSVDMATVAPGGLFAVRVEEKEGGADIVVVRAEGPATPGPLRAVLEIRGSIRGEGFEDTPFHDSVRIDGSFLDG